MQVLNDLREQVSMLINTEDKSKTMNQLIIMKTARIIIYSIS